MKKWWGVLLICLFSSVGQPLAAQLTCPDNLPPRLTIDERGQVTPGAANRVRSESSLDAEVIGSIPGDGVFYVYDGPVCQDGYTWWEVGYLNIYGWMVEGSADEYWVQPYVDPEPVAAGVLSADESQVVVEQSGIQFSFAPALASNVLYYPMYAYTLYDYVLPAHYEFSLVDYAEYTTEEAESFTTPVFQFFDLQELIEANSEQGYYVEDIAFLQTLFAERPEQIDEYIPTMAAFLGTAQHLHSQIHYLDFEGGTAIGFVTFYAQDILPILGDDLFYMVVGITDDEQSMFLMYFPLDATSALENVISRDYEISSIDYQITLYFGDGVSASEIRELDYGDYLTQVEDALNEAPTAAFRPDLALINEMVESVVISPES